MRTLPSRCKVWKVHFFQRYKGCYRHSSYSMNMITFRLHVTIRSDRVSHVPEEMLRYIILHRQRLDSGYNSTGRCYPATYYNSTERCYPATYYTSVLNKNRRPCRTDILATDMFLHLGRCLALAIQTAMPPATARGYMNWRSSWSGLKRSKGKQDMSDHLGLSDLVKCFDMMEACNKFSS